MFKIVLWIKFTSRALHTNIYVKQSMPVQIAFVNFSEPLWPLHSGKCASSNMSQWSNSFKIFPLRIIVRYFPIASPDLPFLTAFEYYATVCLQLSALLWIIWIYYQFFGFYAGLCLPPLAFESISAFWPVSWLFHLTRVHFSFKSANWQALSWVFFFLI